MTYIYVMRHKTTGHIKIGVSDNPQQRSSSLRAKVVHVIEIPDRRQAFLYEGRIHSGFKQIGKWIEGEWFKLEQDWVHLLTTIEDETSLEEFFFLQDAAVQNWMETGPREIRTTMQLTSDVERLQENIQTLEEQMQEQRKAIQDLGQCIQPIIDYSASLSQTAEVSKEQQRRMRMVELEMDNLSLLTRILSRDVDEIRTLLLSQCKLEKLPSLNDDSEVEPIDLLIERTVTSLIYDTSGARRELKLKHFEELNALRRNHLDALDRLLGAEIVGLQKAMLARQEMQN